MLAKDPLQRLKLKYVIKDEWFNAPNTQNIDPSVIESLRSFRKKSTFQQQAMLVLVQHLEISKIKELRDIFFKLDTNQTGTLTTGELENALSSQGIDHVSEEVKSIVANIDMRGNHEINYSEFLAATIENKLHITEEHLWSLFKHFDADDSGFISR